MPNPPIREHIQGLNLGRDYKLYEIDLTKWDLGFIRIYAGDEGDRSVSFAGLIYNPWPIETSGWKVGAGGALPRPKFAVTNLNRIFTPMLKSADGFRMAPFRRIKTYEMFFDFLTDGTTVNPEADSTQHSPIDYYEINKIDREGDINGVEAVQWELITPIDRPNSRIPRIVVTRDRCQRTYRTWDSSAGAFNYTNVDCPYSGSNSFDADGLSVSDPLDSCSHNENGCKARFGEDAVLPALFFPGVEKVRAR